MVKDIAHELHELSRKINQKFLRMFHGPGGSFFKKRPLAAGGKKVISWQVK
jgi:hypothetical protein